MNGYGITLGALADDIEDQLQRQGWTLGDRAERFQRWANEISSLRIHELLTETESDRARKRLWKKITTTAHALPVPGQEVEP